MAKERIVVVCPKCGYIRVLNHIGADAYESADRVKIKGYEEYYLTCLNPSCKFEFLVSFKPEVEEHLFIDKVLRRGLEKNFWAIERWVQGGSSIKRTLWGGDFIIYSLIPRTFRAAVPIEFKGSVQYRFTQTQLDRFRYSVDVPWKATRFCGIKLKSDDPEQAVMVSYWTPKLFKLIPTNNLVLDKRAFERRGEKIYDLKFIGLEEWLRRNCYTELHNNYVNNLLRELVSSKVCTNIFEARSGELGYKGGEYEPIEMELAYDILFQKLAWTIRNITEDIPSVYAPCEYELPVWRTQREYIQSQIDGCIRRSYRPIYPREVARWFWGDYEMHPYLEKIGKVLYVKNDVDASCEEDLKNCKDFTKVVTNLIRSAARAGKYQIIRVLNYNLSSYGILGTDYIPLSYPSSFFLDCLALTVIKAYEAVTLNEINIKLAPSCSNPIKKKLSNARDNYINKELIAKGLVGSEIRKSKLGDVPHQESTYYLTKKGFKYVHRYGDIKTPFVYGD